MYVGVTFLYLTAFLSKICMLVIYVFMLHNKHIYVIVVPHICCSKHPTPCTCFFLWCTVRLDPCHHSGTVSKFTVSQWDHTSLRVGYHDHVWTVSSQRVYESQSTLNPRLHDNLVNRCGWRSSSHSSPLSKTRHVSGCYLLTNISYHSCKTSSVYYIYIYIYIYIYECLFFCTVSPTAVGNQRRGCLLKRDMSSGEDANCCTGRLSISNLRGHTPWVFFWVQSRASSRLTA